MIDIDVTTDGGLVLTGYQELFTQEIRILFDTEKYEVLGNTDIGLNLEQYLGRYSLGNNQIKTIIVDGIRENCLMNEFFEWSVDVNFVKRQGQFDVMVVDIVIDKNIKITTQIR